MHQGRELGRNLEERGGVVGPYDIGGIPAFTVLSGDVNELWDGRGSYLDVAGQKIGQEYDTVRDITSVNGKLAFVGMRTDPNRPSRERTVINYEGREYGQRFNSVYEPFSIDENLAFIADGGDASWYGSVVVVINGVETLLPEGRYEAGEVKDESGKIIYLVKTGGINKDEVILDGKHVYVGVVSSQDRPFGRGYLYIDGQRSGEQYDDVFEVEVINNKLALLVQKEGKGVIIYDGQEYGHHYDFLYNLPDYSTKPYSLSRPGTFTAINNLASIGGKLMYVVTVEKNGETFAMKDIIVKED